MAEDSFKNLVIGFIVFALFGMLILTAVIEVGTNYDKDLDEFSGGSLSLTKFNNSISNLTTNTNALRVRFEKQSVWSAIAGVVVDGIFGIGKDMVGIILLPFSVLSNILEDIFKVPSWVTAVINAILILVIMFSIWRLIKIGD